MTHFVLSRASSGVFVGLLAAPLVHMGNVHDVGSRVGICMSILAIGAVAGPPISGAINTATGNFNITGIYAGALRYHELSYLCTVGWLTVPNRFCCHGVHCALGHY